MNFSEGNRVPNRLVQEIHPSILLENLLAFFEACRTYGRPPAQW